MSLQDESFTALQLQQKLASKQKGPVGKTVTWKKGGEPEEGCEEELFPKAEVVVDNSKFVSLLSARLDQQKEEDRNPWQEYARWEGTHYPESQV